VAAAGVDTEAGSTAGLGEGTFAFGLVLASEVALAEAGVVALVLALPLVFTLLVEDFLPFGTGLGLALPLGDFVGGEEAAGVGAD
jgi:hypothetical protein